MEAVPESGRRSDPIPASIGSYRVDGVLGRGGSGIVLRVHDETLDRPLALKLLADDLDEEARARFMVEARAAGRIIHPNVVQVYAVGVHDGRTYITQELVEGFPLSNLLEVRGKLSPASVIDIGVQTAKGLHRAAEVGVVHRDVKPQNLLVTDDGLVKLADFGLAKLLHAPTVLTDAGTTLGTPHYMSPEQGLAQDLDARSDQYSLGATLYHLVAGHPPFDADNALALLLKHVQEPLSPVTSVEPTCPKGLGEVIERMMSKRREDRFASFAEVIEALEAVEIEPSSTSALAEAAAHARETVESAGPASPSPPAPLAGSAGSVGSVGSAGSVSEGGGGGLRDRILLGLAVAAALAVVAVAAFESTPPSVTTGESSAKLARLPAPETETAPDEGAVEVRSKSSEKDKAKAKDKDKDKEREREKDKDSNKEQKRSRQMPASTEEWLNVLAHDAERAETAVRALGELRDQQATMPLVKVLETAPNARLRAAAARALGELGDTRALEPLRAAAERSSSPEVQEAARDAARRLFHIEEE